MSLILAILSIFVWLQKQCSQSCSQIYRDSLTIKLPKFLCILCPDTIIFHGNCLLHDFNWNSCIKKCIYNLHMHLNNGCKKGDFVSKLCDGCPPSAVLQFSWIKLSRAHVEYSKATLKLWKFSSHWPTAQLIIQLTWMDYTSDLRVAKKFPDWFFAWIKNVYILVHAIIWYFCSNRKFLLQLEKYIAG